MTYRALIKLGAVTTLDRINSDVWKGSGRTMFDAGSLTLMPGQTPVPVLVNHDQDRVVGTVDTLIRWEDADGPWVAAIATIHHRPVWLEKGARASFGYKNGSTNDDFFGHEVVHRGYVTEVSVLIGRTPAEPCAQVLTLRPAEVAREEITLKPTLIRRPNIGQVLGVR